MFINIWVKDTRNGEVHQVGTDEHDSLQLIDGKVEYYNLETDDGTAYGGYVFCGAPSADANEFLNLTLDEPECDYEFGKCRFCRKYGYNICDRCQKFEHFTADTAEVIKRAKETGLSVSDVIALINM